jgi:hypothetical protein
MQQQGERISSKGFTMQEANTAAVAPAAAAAGATNDHYDCVCKMSKHATTPLWRRPTAPAVLKELADNTTSSRNSRNMNRSRRSGSNASCKLSQQTNCWCSG